MTDDDILNIAQDSLHKSYIANYVFGGTATLEEINRFVLTFARAVAAKSEKNL